MARKCHFYLGGTNMAYKNTQHKCWVASRTVEDLQGNKKRIRKFGFKTKKDAIDFENSLSINDFINKNDITINQLCNEFLLNKKDVVKITTYKATETVINLHILPHLDKYKINNINQRIVLKWRRELIDKGLTNSRINRCIKILKEIFKYAKPYYKIDVDPFINIKPLVETKQHKIDYYTIDEFNKLISVIDDLVYKTFFTVLFYCGLRKSEALALQWTDIDFNSKTMNITKSVIQKIKGQPFTLTTPKTESSIRLIRLDNYSLKALNNLKMYYTSSLIDFTPEGFIFGYIRPICENTLNARFDKYVKLAKIKKIRIHDFRHSNASLLINNGASPLLIAKRLGHSNIEQTLNTYSHLYQEKEDNIIDLINKL